MLPNNNKLINFSDKVEIDYKQKYEDLQRKYNLLNKKYDLLENELDIFMSLNEILNVSNTLNNVFEEVIDALLKRVNFDACNLAFIDENGYMQLHGRIYSKFSSFTKTSQEFWKQLFRIRWDYKTSDVWICRVAREEKELHYPEIEPKEFSPIEQLFFQMTGVRSIYYLPIILDGEVIGTITFDNYNRTMHLTEYEKKLIRQRVNLIAHVIEVSKVYHEIKNKSHVITEDLVLASKIQKTLLPQGFPKYSGIDVSMKYIPVIEIGGDYYDFYIPRGEPKTDFGILMTDATGHGVAAAFLTSMVKMSFQSGVVRRNAHLPREVLIELNNSLMGNTADNFVTAFYCYFDLVKRKMKYACAGHNPVYHVNRNSGEIIELHSKGTILGVMNEPKYHEREIDLKKGDRFVLYTDGLTEAVNKEGIQFENSVIEFLKTNTHLDADTLSKELTKKLKEYALYEGKKSFNDDVAFVVVDINEI